MAVYLGNVKIITATQGVFNDVVQVPGDSAQSVMSQKATTYNTKTEYGKCLQINASNQQIVLDDTQVTRINNCDVISIRFVERGGHPSQYENRYVRIFGGIESNYGFAVMWYFNGMIFYNNYKYGQTAYAFNMMSGTQVIPDVNTLVIDRVNGIVKYYAGNTLCTTFQADEFKSDYFIPTNQKKITLSGGDVSAKFYDIQIYDTDIAEFYNNGNVADWNNDTAGAQKLMGIFHGGYQQPLSYTDSSPVGYTGQTVGSWTYSSNPKTMTYTGEITSNNHVAAGYYIGTTDNVNAYLYKSYITVTGGNIKVYGGYEASNGSNSNKILGVYDTTTNQLVADTNDIPPGSYYIYGTKIGPNCFWIQAVSGEPVVQQTNDSWKRVACLFHLKGDVLYNNKLYDDEVDIFYTVPSYTALSSTDLRIPLIRTNTLQGLYPHYQGEIRVEPYLGNNKIYCALNYTTWKQINNS